VAIGPRLIERQRMGFRMMKVRGKVMRRLRSWGRSGRRIFHEPWEPILDWKSNRSKIFDLRSRRRI